MSDIELITRLEALEINHQQLNNTVAELVNLMRFQMVQSERDRKEAEIDRNTFIDQITENSEEIEQLTERFTQFVENAAADRHHYAELNQHSLNEIRRIWEYLSSENRNGGASK